jgi:hypothetical protein
MIDPSSLYETPFSKELVKDSTTYAKKLIKLKIPEGGKPPRTAKGEYIHQVLDSFAELQSIVENLDMAEIFLKSYPVSVSWKKKYDRNHYFTYHYEMWILNAVRLYERLLILINSVFWLEINHKDISYIALSAHSGLKNTNTLKVLNKVHAALSQLQGLKNSVFHRYIYTDDELNEITRYNFLARNSDEELKKELSGLAKIKMNLLYLPKKRKEIENNNKELLHAVDAILSSLNEQYKKHRDSLSD